MSRALATVQEIKAVDSIIGADRIEVAMILGWKVVVQKGEFCPGDLCIFFEIDSVLPDKPEFAFLFSRGYRVRTSKFRKQISQGLALPVNKVSGLDGLELKVGMDLTEILGVKNYSDIVNKRLKHGGQIERAFPPYFEKTKATRIENLSEKFKGPRFDILLGSLACTITEKLDGASASYYIKDGQFGVCSRSYQLNKTETNIYWHIAKKYKIEEFLRKLGLDVAIQGEIIGKDVRCSKKNPYRLEENKFYIHNVYLIDELRPASFSEMITIANSVELGIVPVITSDANIARIGYYGLLDMADGKSEINPDVKREGVVVRSRWPVEIKDIGKIRFKVISKEYLLECD